MMQPHLAYISIIAVPSITSTENLFPLIKSQTSLALFKAPNLAQAFTIVTTAILSGNIPSFLIRSNKTNDSFAFPHSAKPPIIAVQVTRSLLGISSNICLATSIIPHLAYMSTKAAQTK
uniref:Uncharacterized protein MANES_09G053600 n=1 Tax=Rhizophora mucronata TaxID=61149 RepID=A0A2P2NGZ7_RHIMU